MKRKKCLRMILMMNAKDDEEHFTVMVEVEISNPFFGWLLGFGRRVKIIEPAPVVKKFKDYLNNIRSLY